MGVCEDFTHKIRDCFVSVQDAMDLSLPFGGRPCSMGHKVCKRKKCHNMHALLM